MRKILLVVLCCITASLAFADSLTLTSGRTVEGKIVEETPTYVKVDSGVGSVLTYYRDEIATVNGQVSVTAPVAEKIEKAAPVVTDITESVNAAEPVVEPVTTLPDQPAVVNNADQMGGVEQYQQERQDEYKDAVNKVNEKIGGLTNPVATNAAVENTTTVPVVEPVKAEAVPVAAPVTMTTTPPTSHAMSRMANVAGSSVMAAMFLPIIFGGIILIFVVILLPWYFVAKRLAVPLPWLILIPFVNLYSMCKMAGRPGWWCILIFIPFLGIIFYAVILVDIVKKCGKPGWVSILFLVPIINMLIPWYLAFSKD